MSPKQLVLLWLVAYAATFVSFVARITWILFAVSEDPPEDSDQLRRWNRRRRWLLLSEFCSLPLFATTAVLAAAKGWMDPALAVFFALICAVLGFAFFRKAAKKLVADRLGIEVDGAD